MNRKVTDVTLIFPEMNSRISLVLKTKNMSSAQLADELGVQRSGISHILNGRNKPSLDFILRIIKKYPDISVNWLLFGEGPMMNPYPSSPSESEIKPKTTAQRSMLELFNDLGKEDENYATPAQQKSHVEGSQYDLNQKVAGDITIDSKSDQKNTESVYPQTNEYFHPQSTESSRQEADESARQQSTGPVYQQPTEPMRQQPTEKPVINQEPQRDNYKSGAQALQPQFTQPQNQGKKIDRIIIFYQDRSFIEYYPEVN